MMLESQEVDLSPQSKAVMQMHNSIALLNQQQTQAGRHS